MSKTRFLRCSAIGALSLATAVAAFAGTFEENWDTPGQGGDGISSFTSGALFPDNDEAVVDGSRCQYSDPDNPVNPDRGALCRPWNGSDWHVHLPITGFGPKAFSGDGALHLGTHPGPDATWDSYTTAQLSVAVSPPIGISRTPRKESPKLSFWHIVALADDRTFTAVPVGSTADRAVVQAALADPQTGDVVGEWQTIEAFKNPYTSPNLTRISNCFFDPLDDGSTEDQVTGDTGDAFPEPRPVGPSSTCVPQLTWSSMGDWTSVNRRDTGKAKSKLGSLGSLGTGVWVQSKFDLGAYSGQTIRIRFLFSGMEVNGPDGGGWSDLLGNQLGNATRGWIIDDFRVTGTAER